jgi:diketogulonate reductase-like aldo/keto reductase
MKQYSKPYLEQLLAKAKIVPAVNQIENHPWLPQSDVVELSRANGIHIMAYSPLGSTGSPLASVDIIAKLAEKKGTTGQAVLLSWHGE